MVIKLAKHATGTFKSSLENSSSAKQPIRCISRRLIVNWLSAFSHALAFFMFLLTLIYHCLLKTSEILI